MLHLFQGNSKHWHEEMNIIVDLQMAIALFLHFTLLTLLLSRLGNCNGLPHVESAYKDGDIMLGGLFDLHKSEGDKDSCGDLLASNLGYTEAMIFAIESINKNKSLLPNVTLGYDIHDYCLRPAKAVKTAYELVVKTDSRFSFQNCSDANEHHNDVPQLKEILGVIGPMDSASAIMVSSLFDIAHIPSISPLATSVELSSTLYSHFYRTVASDRWRASLLADMAYFFNWTYVGAIALDDSFGRYGIWGIEREAYERGYFCIALTRFVPRVDHFKQVKRIVSDLKSNEKVKVIFIWLYGEYAQDFLDEAVKQNVKDRTWIFADGATPSDPYFQKLHFAEILNGSFGILPKAQSSQTFKIYLTNLEKRNFSGSSNPWWDEYWESMNVPQETSLESRSHLTNSPYIAYTIDAVYTFAHVLHEMYHCREPHGLLEGGKCPVIQNLKVRGDDLHIYMQNVSFQGLTGTVQFDKYGDPLEACYNILNFKRDGEGSSNVLAGWWLKNTVHGPRLKINVNNITWKSGSGYEGIPLSVCSTDCSPGERKVPKSPCCWECVKCPPGTVSSYGVSPNCSECPERQRPNYNRTKCIDLPLNNLQWDSASSIAVTCTAALGVVLTFLFFVVFAKYRNSPIVKASNKELSILLLITVGLFFVLAFLYLFTPTNTLCCTLNVWRYTIYTLCVSILLLKSRKIFNVFRLRTLANVMNSRPRPKKKGFSILFRGDRRHLFFLLSVQLTLIASWISFDPPKQTEIVRQPHYLFVVCKLFSSATGKALFIIIATNLLILSTACIYYAFKGRKIPENFNEARYIGFTMYIVLLSSIAYYPVEFSLEGWYVGVIGGITTLVSSYALLACMFGPKIYVIFFTPEQNTREAVSSEIAKYSLSASAAVVPSGRVAPKSNPGSSPNTSQEL